MPGYILHLTAAKMALSQIEQLNNKPLEQSEINAFYVGSLLPDTVTDKRVSHFRNPKYYGNMIEYPDLEMFLEKYQPLLSDMSCLGYYFHLYIDRKFFKEYLPGIVTLQDNKGHPVIKRDEVAQVEIKRTGQCIPKKQFFSEEYYYGDYTRMNTYLAERYQLPLHLDTHVKNPGITEVEYGDIKNVLDELCGYLDVPGEAVKELHVFEMEHLVQFLEQASKEFVLKNSCQEESL